jgi:hypothetical protein
MLDPPIRDFDVEAPCKEGFEVIYAESSRPQLQQLINQSGASIDRRRQQLVQIGVKLREQLWVHAEQAEMSADALQPRSRSAGRTCRD